MPNRIVNVVQNKIVRFPPALVLAVSLTLTIAAAIYAFASSEKDFETRFNRTSARIARAIESRVLSYGDTLLHTRSFMMTQKHVTRDEFRDFVKGLELSERYPGIEAIAFNELVKPDELAAHVARIRKTGFDTYNVWPEGKRDVYTALIYIEPFDSRTERAFGYDMFSEIKRRDAMIRARDTGRPALSTKLEFLQSASDSKSTGFNLYLPVYKANAPIATPTQRAEALLGYLHARFGAAALFGDLLNDENRLNEQIAFSVYDGKQMDAEDILFRPFEAADSTESQKHVKKLTISIYGNDWTVLLSPLSAFEVRSSRTAPWYILGLGTLASLLLFMFARLATQHNRSIEASEAQIRLITDSLPVLVSYVEPDFRYGFLSKSYEDWFGADRNKMRKQHVRDVVGDDAFSKHRALLDRALHGERLDFDSTLHHRSLGERSIHVQYIPDIDSNGRVRGVVGLGSDVTERKLSEEASRKFAEAQAFLAEAGQVLSSSLDFETILRNVTKLAVPKIADWCSIDLLDSRGVIKQLAVAHVDPDKIKWAESLQVRYPSRVGDTHGVGKVIQTGEPEFQAELSDEVLAASALDPEHHEVIKSVGFTSYICVPLKVRSQTVGAFTLVSAESGRPFKESDLRFAEDLARRVSVAIENGRLYSEAQQINRVKDEFLATLSHELRTPLNIILGHAEILEADAPPLGEDLDSSIKAIHRNAKAQLQIIGDLLDVSAIITGKVTFNPVKLSLSDVARAAVESIRFAAEAKQIKVETHIDERVCLISGDPTRLQQVIWNLLSNAVKFTPKEGTIKIATRLETSRCLIEVSDTGMGIEPDFLPYVFDRFRQEDNSTTRRYGGLGLGLSIVRQLVELHGGTIQVESAGKGQGAKFIVALPAPDEMAGENLNLSNPDEGGAVFPVELKKDLDGLKVLVVDDERDARELLAVILRRVGIDVQMAGNVEEALGAYEKMRPDVIISDIGMPGEDGFSLIKRLRLIEAESGQFTPAAALSAYARGDDRKKSLAAGFQMHLSKPVEGRELTEAIRKLRAEYS